jgi:glycosyltransferase involved in cell wall biosynthesis
VDDGSTDGTKELVASWRTDFPLRYFWQENSGKHVAFNRAVRQAKGLWFLNLDSDDEAAPQALERFSRWRRDLPESFAAIASLCCDETGVVLGGEFPRSPLDACRAELRYHYKVTGDKWLCQRTDVLRRFPFPEPPGLKFVQERTVLAAISRRYRTRYVNEKLKIVHRGPQRLSDNLWRHPLGVALGQRSVLNHELAWFRHAPLHFLRTAANYTRLSLAGGESFAAQWHGLETNGARLLWLATLPLGFILRLRDTNGLNRGLAIR